MLKDGQKPRQLPVRTLLPMRHGGRVSYVALAIELMLKCHA